MKILLISLAFVFVACATANKAHEVSVHDQTQKDEQVKKDKKRVPSATDTVRWSPADERR